MLGPGPAARGSRRERESERPAKVSACRVTAQEEATRPTTCFHGLWDGELTDGFRVVAPGLGLKSR